MNEDLRQQISSILAELGEGKISALRATALIEVARRRAAREAERARELPRGRAHWVKIRVRSDGRRFTIPIPLFLAGIALRLAERFAPRDALPMDMDLGELYRILKTHPIGKVVEIHDDEADVEIWIY